MNNKIKTVDGYFKAFQAWTDVLTKLRRTLNATSLEESIKWGCPCYTLDGKNVVGFSAHKNHVTLFFFQGALLADKEKVLINCQEGKTKAMRQWRFKSAKEVKVTQIKSYVAEAMRLQNAGKAIKPDRNKPVVVPAPLKKALAADKKANAAFKNLSKGRQREYADHVAEAKRDATKEKRIAKILPMIVAGKGLHDKYRNC